MKYYAVKKGYDIGIFEDWSACNRSINGYSGAEYKSFNTKEEAEAYLEDKDLWEEIVKNDLENGYIVVFCDGGYDKDIHRYAFGVVIINERQEIYKLCGSGDNEKYISSQNIMGEILGVIYALDWAITNSISKIKIYHDYEGISKWITGEWKADSDIGKMYVEVFRKKYEGIIQVEFYKVKGHSNNKFNDMVDELAKSALFEGKRTTITGDSWFSLSYYKEEDVQAVIDLVCEADGKINYTVEDSSTKTIYKLVMGSDKVIVSFFKSNNHKLLVQGKPSLLLQILISIINELDEKNGIEPILSSAYRKSIDKKEINADYDKISPNYPAGYPEGVKRLVKQSIINLKYYVEAEDYGQYAFPALRALEGHMKYLITTAGGTVGRFFNGFQKNAAGEFIYTANLSDTTVKPLIEKCYNYYKSERDTTFHFGDVIGITDTTRHINTKAEADEIIKKCLELIQE